MNKIKIISDGTTMGTQVLNSDGNVIPGVTKIEIRPLSAGPNVVEAVLTFEVVDLDITAEQKELTYTVDGVVMSPLEYIDHLHNVLSAGPQEMRLLQEKAVAYDVWQEKTEWVQEQNHTFPISSLGKHRADVMREEIERLRPGRVQCHGRKNKYCNCGHDRLFCDGEGNAT